MLARDLVHLLEELADGFAFVIDLVDPGLLLVLLLEPDWEPERALLLLPLVPRRVQIPFVQVRLLVLAQGLQVAQLLVDLVGVLVHPLLGEEGRAVLVLPHRANVVLGQLLLPLVLPPELLLVPLLAEIVVAVELVARLAQAVARLA